MEQLDPQAVNLAKAIRQTESGGNFQAKGKSGEYGAYQFTEPTWDTYAKKHGVNAKLVEATPEQQNEVAYKQIKEWKDQGYGVGEIASMWNSGKPDAYKDTNYKGVNKMGVTYDVPKYATSVATAYQTIKNGGQATVDPNNPSSVQTGDQQPQFPLTSQKDVLQQDQAQADENLLAGRPQTAGKEGNNFTDTSVGRGILDVIGGGKLAQGLGYALSNLSGTQEKNIQAQESAQETQTRLLKRIKEAKAVGRDTTRLEKALEDITKQIGKGGKDIGNVGTGGITTGQVLGSAGQLAANAALASTGALKTLIKGVPALENPKIIQILEKFNYPKSLNLTRQQAVTRLTAELNKLPVSEIGGETEKLILKALQELEPAAKTGGSLLKGVAKAAGNTALGYALGSGKAGNAVKGVLNYLK